MDKANNSRSWKTKLLAQLWEWTWFLLCQPSPKPFKRWRLFWFRLFGGKAGVNVYLHPRARIESPWNITLANAVTIGDRTHLYALGAIMVGDSTTIAQETYVCAGTHDFTLPHWPLVTPNISIGGNCFIGLRSTILGGVTICSSVLLGANSLVSKDITQPGTYVGQPVHKISDQCPK